jgi:glycyl-tRNA synthetase
MFKTFMGPVEDEASVVYLRPETAQGIFVNFDNVLATSRKKLPFGIAQIGKSFRNEITTGNFIFRTREFEQMEIEYFVKPGSDEKWFDYWVQERFNWYLKLGIKQENLRLRRHGKEELAHYAKDCYDIEYLFPMGWAELEGIANRGDYDLVQHAKHSGKTLSYFDEEAGERYTPYVIEPSAGVDRSALALLIDAYDEELAEGETRVVLHFRPELAPIKVAILPLSRNEKLVPLAREVYTKLRRYFMMQYDDAQSIGRRYRRQDEIGTPFCVTIDFQSLEDNQVTIRERDSMAQIRLPIEEAVKTLQAKLSGESFATQPLWTAKTAEASE